MEKINVIVFGDSVVYGMGDYEQGGWVNRLKLLLDNDGDFYYDVYNMGIPDDTSKDVLKRFTNEINSRFYQGRLILIFECGANDSAQMKLDIDKFKDNISSIIYLAKMRTDNIAFIGLPPAINCETEGRLGNHVCFSDDVMKSFDKVLDEVCTSKGVKYIPLKGVLNTVDTVDGIHPDPEGHSKIAGFAYDYVKKVLAVDAETKKNKCCLCGGPILTPYGNNPQPLSEMGRCCDTCNVTKVIPARMGGIGVDN